ncbi:uncharacterized protein E0L32_003935 [Thyridium curvatum]|uniref:3-beta hydroxysteroid dehydrogenase/isomerase domain-containing protein n=1 Tax=Thyridium curvatum TaxID=1093900 RepID=A0A507BAN7_9PEZI|nr:uncharacterized protein E0L32_003935 [Thyridium curvatum]TPX16286.1 hypothetical protein E0L32_003935 [Thyridium curvatum]
MHQPSSTSVKGTETVLVTGGSGFLAGHLIAKLITDGYTVRATIRSSSKEAGARQAVLDAGVDTADRLTFLVADLTVDDGWPEAMQGCTFVHHVASPFPSSDPKNEDEVIRPAKEGTLRVLMFARNAGVKRVIMTSSFAAIGYGHKSKHSFNEEDWSVIDGEVAVPAYHKSKTLAEKAAWDFIGEGQSLELCVINATGIFGPVLSPDLSSSIQIVKNMLTGGMAACPQLYFGVVDVRDAAYLHVLAMLKPEAKGQRIIATSDGGPTSMIGIANIIRRGRPQYARRVPTRELPNFVVRTAALFSPAFRRLLPGLGVSKQIDNSKAISMGWNPRSIEECICDTVDSLVRYKIVEVGGEESGV